MIKKAILLFLDGVGIHHNKQHTTITINELPVLHNVVHKESTPIDAIMGVPGTPQSATGQTSLLCGINAQKLAGRHEEGFPGPLLKKLIAQENIFSKLARINRKSTFANGYWLTDIHNIDRRLKRRMSVTTVAALSGIGSVRTMEFMKRGEAVYQDITHEILRQRGEEIPAITEEEAAKRLVAISGDFDFTLFEYFQSDMAGHGQDPERVKQVLMTLERFIGALLQAIDFSKCTLIITSDHGNIEDLSTPRHTRNPVPYFVRGPGREILTRNVRDLSDITPRILEWFSEG